MCVSSNSYIIYHIFGNLLLFIVTNLRLEYQKEYNWKNNKLGPRFYVNYTRVIASNRVEVTRYLPEYFFCGISVT